MAIVGIVLFALLLLAVPIGIALSSAAAAYILVDPLLEPTVIFRAFFSFIGRYSLMAIPLFIFAGFLMEKTGLIKQLFSFADSLVGHLPGEVRTAAQATTDEPASEVGGEGHNGIDDEGPPTVVLAHVEGDLVTLDGKPTGHHASPAANVLIAVGRRQPESSGVIERDRAIVEQARGPARHAHAEDARVRSGRKMKVELHVAVAAVENGVDAVVDLRIAHRAKGRQPPKPPLRPVAHEVTGDARQRFRARDPR